MAQAEKFISYEVKTWKSPCNCRSPSLEGVCSPCASGLAGIAAGFIKLRQQGTELKKRKSILPHPKYPQRQHYRDISAQKEFIALRNPTEDAIMKVREKCYRGSLMNTPMRIISASTCALPTINHTYFALNKIKMLSENIYSTILYLKINGMSY